MWASCSDRAFVTVGLPTPRPGRPRVVKWCSAKPAVRFRVGARRIGGLKTVRHAFPDSQNDEINDGTTAFTTVSSQNPPVSGGPMITPTEAAESRNSACTSDDEPTSSSISERRAQWNVWWIDALDNKNLVALKLIERMPFASTEMIISSMRMMHDPLVFEYVVGLLVKNRTNELETVEHVGGVTAAGWAAKKGNAKALEILLSNGADANASDATGATPLLHAVVVDSKIACRVLLHHGAHPDGVRGADGPGEGSLEEAASTSKKCKKKKATAWTPLTFAARKGMLPIVDLLLEHAASADVHGDVSGRQTALIHAAMGGHVSVVASLVHAGANPTLKDAANFDATMHAGFRHPNNARLLAAIAKAANQWKL